MKQTNVRMMVALATLACFGIGCSGGMRMINATRNAYTLTSNEQASIEVCLDRIGDIDASLTQVNALLFETPISSDAASIKALTEVPPERIKSYTDAIKKEGAYSLPNRQVPNLKIYVLHNKEAIPAAKNISNAKYKSLMVGVADLGGEKGVMVTDQYVEVKKINDKIAELEGQVGLLESEADEDATDEARKEAIKREIETIEASITTAEAEVDPAETALFKSIADLGTGTVDSKKLDDAKNIYKVLEHAALMEVESLVMSIVVGIQTVQALPNLPGELQGLAMRWVQETINDVTGSAKEAINVTPKLDIGAEGVSIGFEGLDPDKFDVDKITDRMIGRVTKFYDDAVNAPGRISSISSKVTFQVEFLAALTQSFANLAGTTFSETPKFAVEAAAAAVSK